MRLTDISLRALKVPEKGSVTYFDDTVRGFGVRVSSGGTKSYILLVGKSRTRVQLGRVGTIGLKDAREKARSILAERQLGRFQSSAVRFSDALDRYINEHVEGLKPSTKSEIKRLLNAHFRPKLGHDRLTDITRQTVASIIGKLIDTPSTALHAHAAISAFFRWARGPYLEYNPLDGLKPPSKPISRDHVLTQEELAKLFSTARALGTNFGTLVTLLILTAQRLNQIASLQAEWIDRNEKLIRFPAEVMKNNRAHVIPYGDMTAAILDILPTKGLLLPARGRDTPMSGFSKLKPALDKKARVSDYRLHDLRRTAASSWQALGIPIAVTEKYLSHAETTGGIVAVYQRHSYLPEMLEAVQKWEAHLSQIIKGIPGAGARALLTGAPAEIRAIQHGDTR